MNQFKEAFIRLALDNQVLKFGDFTLKSGRKSPYFFNSALFYHGGALAKLGECYAKTLIDSKINFQQLFGPAYKGLPLATATAIALSQLGKDITVTFNRKEAKDHGEGGWLIGAPLQAKIVIIDDVITAGTAFREAQTLINNNGGELTGVIIALDRCEQGAGEASAIQEIRDQGIEVLSIVNFFDLVNYLKANNQEEQALKLLNYQQQYA